MKPKGLKAVLNGAEADGETLRDKVVPMKCVEPSQHTAYVDWSVKYAYSVSTVAELTAENDWLHSEEDTPHATQAKADTELERLWALVNTRTAESLSQSEPPGSLPTQNIVAVQSQ